MTTTYEMVPDATWHRGLRTVLHRDFATFIGQVFLTADPGTIYLPNWHIERIAEYLEAARRGEIQRLIINMPPRALKSICASVAWPAWILGHDPSARVVAASYSAGLAIKHSVDCRAVMQSRWYRELFPDVHLARDQNEKHKFMTTRRGYRLATSVGGTLTGEGGNFLILDDPLSPLQAASKLSRQLANDWFSHTFASRLDNKARGVIVLVMQRLHDDDLSGHLLEQGGWEHLCFPAIAERDEPFRKAGDPLHVDRESLDLLDRARRELGSHAFAAQYQQAPVPEQGNMIRGLWFLRHATPPEAPERIVQSWDTAIKSGPTHDASACLTFAESKGVSYLVEAKTGRMEYPDLRKQVIAQAARWKPQAILMEDKASGQQLLQDLKRETYLPLIAVMPRGDKIMRFAGITAMIEGGRLSLPESASWLSVFEEEILAFPGGAHDDQADALSQYFQWLQAGKGGNPNLLSL